MINDIKKIFEKENATLVLMKGSDILIDRRKGILPLIELVEKKIYEGYDACDLIVGKAAAMLYILLKVKSIHAVVLTFDAKAILESHGIKVTYDTLTDKIINRTKTDLCPMEKAVKDVTDENIAYQKIKETLENIKNAH